MKIEMVSPEELSPHENNAKLHPAEQVEQIKKSIQDFGFNDPIAVWKDNKIIEGHGRYIAALELGLKKVPIIRLENLSDEERRAYMLVHNKLTMNTEFDFNILDMELAEIVDIDMAEFGFESIDGYNVNAFFDQGVAQPKEKEKGIKLITETEEEAKEAFDVLVENGFKPVML